MSVSIVVVQEGEGDCIEQDEEETVTPRNLWKNVTRKSKVLSKCKTKQLVQIRQLLTDSAKIIFPLYSAKPLSLIGITP